MSFSPLVTVEVDRDTFQLMLPLQYTDSKYGNIVARQSFITDFASTKVVRNLGMFVIYSAVVGYGRKAATIHDWLYSGFGIKTEGKTIYPSRKEVDKIFYRALREEGIARWRAALMYAGVRIGGRSSYKFKDIWYDNKQVWKTLPNAELI